MKAITPFREATPSHGVILVRWRENPLDDLATFAFGYWRAAQRLASSIEFAPTFADHEGFPVIFLYRHALELYLKSLCFRAATVLGLQSRVEVELSRLWTDHSLRRLLNAVAPVLSDLRGHRAGHYETLVADVEGLVLEVERLDPGSYFFRYPVNARGDAVHTIGTSLNVLEFSRRLDSVLDQLRLAGLALESDLSDIRGTGRR